MKQEPTRKTKKRKEDIIYIFRNDVPLDANEEKKKKEKETTLIRL